MSPMILSSHSASESGQLPGAHRWRILPIVLLVPLCGGLAKSVAAQSRFPVVVSAGAHSLTLPWHPGPVTNRFNPVLVVGTDRTLRSGDTVRMYGMANLGYFQHYWWMTGVFLSAEFGVGRALPLGFHADLRLGVGYLHYFWRRKTLVLKDGRYVSATDWGRPSVMVPLSVVLGYSGGPARPFRFAPFVSAQWAAQAPFTDEAPVMTHLFLAVGVRIDLGRGAAAGR
jgi:hypothetical protein